MSSAKVLGPKVSLHRVLGLVVGTPGGLGDRGTGEGPEVF